MSDRPVYDPKLYVSPNKPGFLPGNPGKIAGTRSHRKPTIQFFEQQGFDWRLEAIKRFRDTSLPEASRDYALGLIADRCDPKLKAVEISGALNTESNRVMINIVGAETTVLKTVEETVIPTVTHSTTLDSLLTDVEDVVDDDTVSVDKPSD